MEYRENIAIIGLSTGYNLRVAKVISDDYSLRFTDTVRFLEYFTTYSILELIQDIQYHDKSERAFYKELSEYNTICMGVSATALRNAENIKNLKQKSYIIYLSATREVLKRRFLTDPENYLKEEILRDFDSYFSYVEREIIPLADIVVDSFRLSPVSAAIRAEEMLAEYFQIMEAKA
jgi:shikimate kinase